ncbi:SpoIIE family protein phosphatase [Parachlamydia acanthamoebae]|uniref:SpoIIE family protein phosphatase n=1 Tax=Parachlamydia acanthamoebae TaxID=83552 RepID=UPI00075149A0|nr:SpoIIE family protein phosphatase [Parachlamydia acanthamoebae]
MTVNLNNVLKSYYIAAQDRTNQPKINHPILILQCKNGVKELNLIVDRRQVSWYDRLLAFFGRGNASLKNVRNYLDEHKTEISAENISAIKIIDSKISLRNQSSRIQKIPLLNSWVLHLEKSTYSCYVGTTHVPTKEDRGGIIDFTKVFPIKGLAYIADGSGHAVSAVKQEAYADLWKEFDERIGELSHPESPVACQKQLESLLSDQSKKFEEKGYASTLIVTQLIAGADGKKYLAHVAVGDSDLYCLRKNGRLEQITSMNKDDPSRNTELAGDVRQMHRGLTEVHPGDKIIGVTDGITDFMSKDILRSILLEKGTTPENLGTKLFNRLLQGNSKGSKSLKREDSSDSDDISVFFMTVPESIA